MKDLGYGAGYKYAHDFDDGVIGQQNLPENLAGRTYYEPVDRGFEKDIARRLARVKEIYRETAAKQTADERKGQKGTTA
jgi:putative ATPase